MLQKHIGNFDISYIPPISLLYHSYILQHCIKKRERLISLKKQGKHLKKLRSMTMSKTIPAKCFRLPLRLIAALLVASCPQYDHHLLRECMSDPGYCLRTGVDIGCCSHRWLLTGGCNVEPHIALNTHAIQ